LTRALACLALLALAAPAAQAQDGRAGSGSGQRMRGYANPSAAIAAEIAFAQLAQAKGQWTAFRETAAEDAVLFTPAMVPAQAWLRNRPNPARAIAWQPHQVWSSCDGSLMVTTGAWQNDGKTGWFTTVWQRQQKGGYKWVLDHGDDAKEPIPAPEMIAARVAECPERRARPAGPPPGAPGKRVKAAPVPFDPVRREGRSQDGTLTWQVAVDASGARRFTAQMMIDGQMQEIRNQHVAGG
jgi:hypothetical protein